MSIELPNENWRFVEGDDGELIFIREHEDVYNDMSMDLSLDSPMEGEYSIFFSQGADYLGAFGTHEAHGTWDGTEEDAERLLRAAEGMWSVWSREKPAGLRENKRPISIDPEFLNNVMQEILSDIAQWLEYGGFASGKSSKRLLRKRMVGLVDVRGVEKPLYIRIRKLPDGKHVYFEMVHGATYRPRDGLMEVHVHFASVRRRILADGPEKAMRQLIGEIRESVIHELTHARDLIDMRQVRKSKVGRRVQHGYLNSPHEVRAYGRQIADRVEAYLRAYPEALDGGNLGDRLLGLVQKVGADLFWFDFDSENQRTILQMVIGHLQDLDMLEH